MFYCKCIIIILLTVLTGCSTPYLEQGFKSEADFEFSKKFQLTPAEVEFAKASKLRAWDVSGLRQHNITSKNAYDFIINEMQTSGFNKKFPKADIFDYLYWRPEAIKNNITVLEQISIHNNMVKKNKEQDEEEKRKDELARKAIDEKERLQKNNEKLALEQAQTLKYKELAIRQKRMCDNIKNVSVSVTEFIGSLSKTNPSTIKFVRSVFVDTRGSGICSVVIYTNTGPVLCHVLEEDVKNNIIQGFSSLVRCRKT